MRRNIKYTILLLTILLSGSFTYGQGIQGAFAFGGNLSQIDGDKVFGFKKIGLNTSAIAIIPFKEKWGISLEASFAQKGSYQKYPPEAEPDKELPYYNIRLSYAEVPVLFHFTDKEILTVGLGMSWGRLVKINEIEWGEKTDVDVFSGHYSRNDICGLIDIRIPVYKRLNINFRYSYSFKKIRTREFENDIGEIEAREQYNNVITLRMYYIFNERNGKSNE